MSMGPSGHSWHSRNTGHRWPSWPCGHSWPSGHSRPSRHSWQEVWLLNLVTWRSIYASTVERGLSIARSVIPYLLNLVPWRSIHASTVESSLSVAGSVNLLLLYLVTWRGIFASTVHCSVSPFVLQVTPTENPPKPWRWKSWNAMFVTAVSRLREFWSYTWKGRIVKRFIVAMIVERNQSSVWKITKTIVLPSLMNVTFVKKVLRIEICLSITKFVMQTKKNLSATNAERDST